MGSIRPLLCYTCRAATVLLDRKGDITMPKTICLLVLLAAVATVSAQTYKWRDASGTVQYSDTPPPPGARDVQQLRKATAVPTAPAGVAPAQAKPASDPEADFQKRLAAKRDADAKQAKAQEDEQVRARHCDQAKAQLTALESGVRVARFNDQGERISLDDDERERAKAEAQKAVQTWCK